MYRLFMYAAVRKIVSVFLLDTFWIIYSFEKFYNWYDSQLF